MCIVKDIIKLAQRKMWWTDSSSEYNTQTKENNTNVICMCRETQRINKTWWYLMITVFY